MKTKKEKPKQAWLQVRLTEDEAVMVEVVSRMLNLDKSKATLHLFRVIYQQMQADQEKNG